MIKCLSILLFTIVLLGKSYAQEIDKSIFIKTDQYLAKTIDSLKIVGLNYLVLIDNEAVYKKAFGAAHAQLSVPMTIDKSFPVYF
ncbi:hypothetical protein [Flammeovirga sp. EKP202]|uniref:hypothetical protein n=1 Tax=Flammeovirga sp. EKP202 TaxID=2770592 RepID=UPI00165FA726|nr:hypothetical protein [Flammeovirga sp. EKP202]MBD0403024.1 hypothetical protein [Flammeovirga sp. EKP202]